ncbi:MAG: GGDEF domain-containing protein [Phycisphaerae bacterium]|nr:GGDEF domain-containing protein [Phycisphaerae bacterium]
MAISNIPDFPRMGAHKILLIGDVNNIFLDADAIRRLPCEIRADMPDAIELAGENSFSAIAVMMSAAPAKLASILKSLRQANCNAKIILLAQVYEEPAAMEMVSSACNGTTLADDYLICPVQTSKFCEAVSPSDGGNGRLAADNIVGGRISQLEKMATEDELTGLKNRRYIWEFSKQIIARARSENKRVTLLIFDIDNFKHYNDVYGHSAGDEILKEAAVLMQKCCRSHDVVGRVGGDEFAVVFWDDPRRELSKEEAERRSEMADHPKEAIFIAKRFRKQLSKAELHLLGPEGKGVLAISGGLASFPRDGSNIDELFNQADKALLEAKRSGKNKIYLVGEAQGDIADVE